MGLDNESINRLKKSFPSKIDNDVARVLAMLPRGKFESDLSSNSFEVKVDNELLLIPERVYFAEVNAVILLTLSDVQKEIINCLYTRHHDGHVREKALKGIILSENCISSDLFGHLGVI
jgi:hypothetical protein